MGKRESTRERLLLTALELFEEQGYEPTTVEQIARTAGVTPMTFFRHFPTKDAVVVEDPYDPMIAAIVAAQPRGLPALERVCGAFSIALAQLGAEEDEQTRRRIRIAAAHPGLRAKTWEGTQATQLAIVEAMVSTGVSALEAEVATGACLGALTAALLHGGATHTGTLGAQLRAALAYLAPDREVSTDAR